MSSIIDNFIRPLAAKAEKHQAKIDKQKKKAAKLTDKINKGNQKINKWKAKIADAQKTQAYCEQLLATHALPKPLQMFFQSMLDRQNKKIERCQEKINTQMQKIRKLQGKRNKCNIKIRKHKAKIDKLANIDSFITNMASSQGRRENFIQVLTGMRKSSLDKKSKKLASIEKKIAGKELALSNATTETEKVKLQQQIDKLKAQKENLEGKVEHLEAMTEKLDAFSAMSEQDIAGIITATTESAKAAFEFENYDDMEDVVIVEAEKAIDSQQIDQQLTDDDKKVIAWLESEINIDQLFYGKVTAKTMEDIQKAGFEFDGSTFTKAAATQEMQEGTPEHSEPEEEYNPVTYSEPEDEISNPEPQPEQKQE